MSGFLFFFFCFFFLGCVRSDDVQSHTAAGAPASSLFLVQLRSLESTMRVFREGVDDGDEVLTAVIFIIISFIAVAD